MEFKGIITIPEGWSSDEKAYISLTCCEKLPKIMIGDVDLHAALEDIFSPDAEDQFDNSYKDTAKPLTQLAVKYVILDKPPVENISFNDLALSVIDGWMIPNYISGCYSEYTCGYGGFDFLVNQHSIFKELEQHEGKYVHLVL